MDNSNITVVDLRRQAERERNTAVACGKKRENYQREVDIAAAGEKLCMQRAEDLELAAQLLESRRP